MAELEDLAGKGRQRQDERRTRERGSAARDRERAARKADALAVESLDRWGRVRRAAIAVAVFGGIALVAATRSGSPQASALFAIVGGALVTLFLGLWGSHKAAGLFAAHELRKLERLPFAIDVAAYRAAMGRKRSTCTARLTVHFAGAIEEADRSLFADAVAGGVTVADAAWSNGTFALTSEPLTTVFHAPRTRGGASRTYHGNYRVHCWVRTAIHGVLVPIHRRSAITSVEISLDG